MSRNAMQYDFPPYRPPSEASSLLLRVTRGCPWNQCTFCSMYKRTPFEKRPLEEIFRDIGSRFAIDIAFLPISGLKNLLFGREAMDPEEAARAALLLKAGTVVPIHYHFDYGLPRFLKRIGVSIPGTTEGFFEALDRLPFAGRKILMEPGETWNPSFDGP